MLELGAESESYRVRRVQNKKGSVLEHDKPAFPCGAAVFRTRKAVFCREKARLCAHSAVGTKCLVLIHVAVLREGQRTDCASLPPAGRRAQGGVRSPLPAGGAGGGPAGPWQQTHPMHVVSAAPASRFSWRPDIGMERGRQQNDSPSDGYSSCPADALSPSTCPADIGCHRFTAERGRQRMNAMQLQSLWTIPMDNPYCRLTSSWTAAGRVWPQGVAAAAGIRPGDTLLELGCPAADTARFHGGGAETLAAEAGGGGTVWGLEWGAGGRLGLVDRPAVRVRGFATAFPCCAAVFSTRKAVFCREKAPPFPRGAAVSLVR